MLLSHKRKEIGSLVMIWMNLESVIQSKVRERGKNTVY